MTEATEKLRQLQLTQLDILKRIDELCRQNGITYSLYGGTLLGAVRHRGFIPWDDDLDICMTRPEYERFAAAWDRQTDDDFFLQTQENEPAFTQTFAKVRKNGTAFVQPGEEQATYHTGIFVDIFPLDRVPAGRLARKMQFVYGALYLLYSRGFASEKDGRLMYLLCKLALGVVPKKKRIAARNHFKKKISRYTDSKLELADFGTLTSSRRYLSGDIIDHIVDLPFEDGSFMCFAGWEEYLKKEYGDYMTLPPEAERTWTHHPVKLEFESMGCHAEKEPM